MRCRIRVFLERRGRDEHNGFQNSERLPKEAPLTKKEKLSYADCISYALAIENLVIETVDRCSAPCLILIDVFAVPYFDHHDDKLPSSDIMNHPVITYSQLEIGASHKPFHVRERSEGDALKCSRNPFLCLSQQPLELLERMRRKLKRIHFTDQGAFLLLQNGWSFPP